MFRIIFVLDVLKGIAVHAIRGERSKYRPVQGSRACDSSSPLEIVSALKPKEVYIADLDRLQHMGDNLGLIGKISASTRTMADIGAESTDDVEKCLGVADTVILGTETASLDLIKWAAVQFPNRIDVSIDIKSGVVLTGDRSMMMRPRELAELLNGIEIRDIIILDLDRVGTGAGVDIRLLKDIAEISTHSVLAGGGIRHMNDISALEKAGVSGALVATAVHNGNIPVEAIRQKRKRTTIPKAQAILKAMQPASERDSDNRCRQAAIHNSDSGNKSTGCV